MMDQLELVPTGHAEPTHSDYWATPKRFFDEVNAEFHFDLDVCALASTAKVKRFFTPSDDGLKQDWFGRCWCNPPYSDIRSWMRKAKAEIEAGRCELAVFLVPSRTGTDWWHEYAQHCELRWIRGRLKFNDSGGSAPFDCCLVVMRES